MNPAEALLKRIVEECVEDAGSDDPKIHPPSTNLLSDIHLFLAGGSGFGDSPEELLRKSAQPHWSTPEELLRCKGRIWNFMDKYFENEIQLHEQIALYYVVDGWIAQYSYDDGNTWPVKCWNVSPMFALSELAIKINGMKAKRIENGGYH